MKKSLLILCLVATIGLFSPITMLAQTVADSSRSPFKILADVSSTIATKGFCTSSTVMVTAEQMNSVYSTLNVSKEEFVKNYKFAESVVCRGVDGDQTICSSTGTDNFVLYAENDGVSQVTTTGLTWILSDKYRRENAGKYPSAQAVFVKGMGSSHQEIVVLKLESEVPMPVYEPSKDYALPKKIKSYWSVDQDCGKDVAQINVYVPSIGEKNEDKAVIIKDLQDLFSEDICQSVKNSISYDYKVGNNDVVKNSVSLLIKSAQCDDYAFAVSLDGRKLLCNDEVVATLSNNTLVIDKSSTVAKELLNTNRLYVTFTYFATYTTSCMDEQEIPHATDYPEFTIRCVRPLNANKPEEGFFVDGLDFGIYDFDTYMTTLLPVSEMVKITDWRGQEVIKGDYLWDYYGVKRITCDNSQVLTDITGEVAPLSAFVNSSNKQVLKAGIVDSDSWTDSELKGGLAYAAAKMGLTEAETYDQFFYYKNNGATVFSRFYLYFPIIVEYTWGTISDSVLKVAVLPTIEATGIESLAGDEPGSVYYDLSGRKLRSINRSGIYVSQGRRLVIKK